MVDGDLIVEVTRDVPDLGRVLNPWWDWLNENHPEDLPVLFRHDEENRVTGEPSTTPEALELYRQRLAEYEAWEQDNE